MSIKAFKKLLKNHSYSDMADAICSYDIKKKDADRLCVSEQLDFYKRKYNEHINIIAEQQKEMDYMKKRMEALEETVRILITKLNKNSGNSSKPPSSDGFKKVKKNKSLREKSGKKPGGQTGHKGKTLKMVDSPDEFIEHRLHDCSRCGHSLVDVEIDRIERAQVFDIPMPKILATEYRSEVKVCPHCAGTNKAEFPAGVYAGAQYGGNIRSTLVYMSNFQFIPYDRLSQYTEDIFGHRISKGTIGNIIDDCYDALCGFERRLKESIKKSPVVNFDESGISIKGSTEWLFSASTEKLTCYNVFDGRGHDAMDEMGILGDFKGVAVHDGWKAYLKYSCLHALCNVHHLRELKGIIENNFDKLKWPALMKKFLKEAKKFVDNHKESGIPPPQKSIDEMIAKFDRIIKDGFDEYPAIISDNFHKKKKGKRRQSDSKNLLDRLIKYKNSVLMFLRDFSVPFDNNLAERDIRMVKVKQKISGTFRSWQGAKYFCRIRSYISTCIKNSKNILQALKNALAKKPFFPTFA